MRRARETAYAAIALPKRPGPGTAWAATKERDIKSQEIKRLNMGWRRLRSFEPGTLPEASAAQPHAQMPTKGDEIGTEAQQTYGCDKSVASAARIR